MKTYSRVISLLQNEMFYFGLGTLYGSDRDKELSEKEKQEEFINSIIKNKNKPLMRKTDLLFNQTQVLPILYLRTIDDSKIESIIKENYELIKRSEVDSLYNYGDIIHITTPNNEELIMDVEGQVFEDDMPGASIRGHGFLVDSKLNKLNDMQLYKLNYSMCKVRLANSDEKKLLEIVVIFNRLERKFGEFAPTDLIYLVDQERFDFVNDRNNEELLQGMLDNKVNLVFDDWNLKYCVSEYGLQIPDIEYTDERE